MNAWTDDFIAQCLCCIPDRSYAGGWAKELRPCFAPNLLPHPAE